MSLICRDCKEYIFKGEEQIKDGVYIDDSFYSEAVCDECLENYPYCEKHDQYNFKKEN